MRKIFLLLMTLVLFSCGYCSAIDWQSVDADNVNLNLYVDRDSVKNINPWEYLYAIKYRIGYKPEQVAYIRSNYNNNYIGVIQVRPYNINEYKPQAVFANPRVFMKPVSQESFLVYAHRWVFNAIPGAVQAPKKNTTETAKAKLTPQETAKLANSMKKFVSSTSKTIKDNWCPPKSGRNSRAIIIVEIGPDGSLQNYKFAKSSGDKLTDRSIISAIEFTAPFKEISNLKTGDKNIDVQFVFEYKYFRKSVM